MNISANISEEKAGCSTEVEISGHWEGEKGIRYGFMVVSVFMSWRYSITGVGMGINNGDHFFHSEILKKKKETEKFQKWEICELILSSLIVLNS